MNVPFELHIALRYLLARRKQAFISAGRETQPVQIKGIDPVLEQQVTDIKGAMQSGSLDELNKSGGFDGILLGKDLAAKLGVAIGDSVSLLTPQGTLSPMGMIPRSRRLRVAGIFSLGLYEFDSSYGFVSLDVARRLFDKEQVDLIQLRVDDIYLAPRIAQAIPTELGAQYVTENWSEMNRSLFSAL